MIDKPKAILLGPVIGELGWEFQRFAPMLPFMKTKKYKKQNITYIILTRKDRFDLYGKYANILVPLNIEGDYDKYMPNCFRLNNFPKMHYEKIVKNFYNKYAKQYNIIRHVYPKLIKNQFLNKGQFSLKEMVFNFSPREENVRLVNEYISNDKKIVVLAPRYRKGFRRNWNQWQDLYNKISKSKMAEKFNFVVCGKPGEYVPDEQDRFLDINKITLNLESSLVGLLLATMKRSSFTCGSQSAIPNLSLLMGVKSLQWGHQKKLHTIVYNIKNTPVKFLEDRKYNISYKIIYNKLEEQLKKI